MRSPLTVYLLLYKLLNCFTFHLVSGLAKLEGEVVEVGDNCQTSVETTKYELTGIVVHSGQASGGHYFSYIVSK